MEWDAPVLEACDLERTYDGGAYSYSWAAVLDYQAGRRYSNTHPNKGSHAISSALEIPRGRVRSWVGYDSKPDVVRGIEVAREYGWLEASPRDDTFQA